MLLSSRKIGSVVLMLVLTHLFTPAAHALPPSGSLNLLGEEGFAPAWEWLVSLVSSGEAELHRIWEKAGNSIDLNGVPHNDASELSKAGSSMDPDGHK